MVILREALPDWRLIYSSWLWIHSCITEERMDMEEFVKCVVWAPFVFLLFPKKSKGRVGQTIRMSFRDTFWTSSPVQSLPSMFLRSVKFICGKLKHYSQRSKQKRAFLLPADQPLLYFLTRSRYVFVSQRCVLLYMAGEPAAMILKSGNGSLVHGTGLSSDAAVLCAREGDLRNGERNRDRKR